MFRKAPLLRKTAAFSYSAIVLPVLLAGTPAFAADVFFKSREIKLTGGTGAGGAR